MVVQEDYIFAFQRWCQENGKGPSGPKYVSYLSCLNKPVKDVGTHSTWDGFYKVIYGRFAEKDVLEIIDLSEFDRIYGGLRAVFTNGDCQDGMLPEGFQKAKDWAQSPPVKGPSCLNAALSAYVDFLSWVELERKKIDDPLELFRLWLHSPERRNGKGYASKTADRYADALGNFDRVLLDWGIDLKGRRLCEINSAGEFDDILKRIREHPEFDCYNNNLDRAGNPHNYNGTGKGDPSASLYQFGEYIRGRTHDDSPVDRLDIAIREFKLHRKDADWNTVGGGEALSWQYQTVNKGIRDYFGKLDETRIRAFGLPEVTELFTGVKEGPKVVFEPMWSGKVGQGWSHIQKAYIETPQKVIDFLGDLAAAPTIISSFASPGFERPGGFGGSVISELLMKFHPTVGFKYGGKTVEGLKLIGLLDFEPHVTNFKQSEYDHVLSLAKMIRGKVEECGVTRCLEDAEPPDLLTVNEFIGWVCEHRNLLEGEFKKAANDDVLPANVDRLTAALKMFKENQGEGPRPKYDTPDVWQGMARTQYENFVSQNEKMPHSVSWYLDEVMLSKECPEMTPARALAIMMNVRPAEFSAYSPMIDKMLIFTGVLKKPFPEKITVESYEANKALQGQVLAKMHELGICKAAEDPSPADYFTVNEFAWWLSDEKNQNLIKEKIMSAKMKKPDSTCAVDSEKSIVETLKDDADSMMARLTASLLTKPFVILAGASGTGKSRMVKKLAYMTCRADMLRSAKDETPGNYCMIAVKPNWHDSSELLGYKSSFAGHEYVSSDFVKFILRAFAFPETPFFVCLDEMNLAPVEQYFAEYLSAVESAGKNTAGEWVGDPLIQCGEFGGDVLNLNPDFELADDVKAAINTKGLFIPQNLFVVGTVNMDDTTNQFSRKVLDRAMTIMMNEVDFSTLKGTSYEKLTNELRIKNEEIQTFVDRTTFKGDLLDDPFVELLNGIKGAVQNSPFEIGYRFAIETTLYREALKLITGKKGADETELKGLSQTAVDHLSLMKVLPRITGTLADRKDVLDRLAKFLGEQLETHHLSATMLEKMQKAASGNGEYISFWP